VKPYSDLSWPERSAIMDACAAAGSKFHERTSNGFRVAIGRHRYGATVEAMSARGFRCIDLVMFPLGTDKPDEQLRHDSRGIPSCNWLFADFTNKE